MNELSTSRQNSAALPENWIERIFTVMAGRYGSKFTDAWRGADPRVTKAIWAEDLAGFTGDEIKCGLDACRDRDWPPTCPEFRKLCRPPLDYFNGYSEAVTMMRCRNSSSIAENKAEKWTNAAFFWAAVQMGSDLTAAPYEKLDRRWKAAVDRAIGRMMAGELPAVVPTRPERLQAPERISAIHPKAQAILADLLGKTETKEQQS